MADAISARSVKKFDGSNYQGWKFQINSLFVANEIQDVVDGTRVMPPVVVGHEEEAKQWVRDNAKAMFLISSSMEDAQLQSVLTCTSAKAMWDQLSLIHEQKSATNKLGLLQKFHGYQMCAGDSAVQHVAKIQNMAAQLRDIGENVSEETIMAKVLASLTAKFSTLQTAWDSVDPARQTVANLMERLIREDARLSVDADAASALVASRNNKKKDSAKPKNPRTSREDIECFRCHEKGHFARGCRNQRRRKSDPEKSRDCAFVAENGAKTKLNQKSSGDESARARASLSQVEEIKSAGQSQVWLTDSGASRHLTYRREWLTDYRAYESSDDSIRLGDNESCKIVGVGTVHIKKLIDGVWRDGRIENVLYVPKLRKNLFSVGVCTSNGFEVLFKDNEVKIVRDGEIVASGLKQENDLYRMLFKVIVPGSVEEANVATLNLRVWHERLGHVGQRAIRDLVKKGLVNGVSLSDKSDFFCESCQLGKAHRLPFKKVSEKVETEIGEVMHTDVCGPMSTESPGGSRYFLTFKDDASSYRHVYFMRHKSEVFEKFKVFEKLIRNKFGRSIKILRSDNGREFCNQKMDDYLESCGIKKETTAPYTPEQNGKAERDNRTIVESARTMILSKNLPLSLWAEAVNTAIYALNRTVWTTDGVTPYEMWVEKTPNLKHLRIFGSEAFVHVPKQFTKKFDARAKKVFFVGYEGESENYRLYNPGTKTVSVSRNVTFHERVGKITTKLEAEEEDDDGEVIIPRRKEENEQEETQYEEEEAEPPIDDQAVEEQQAAGGQQAEHVQGVGRGRGRRSIDPAQAATPGREGLRPRENIRPAPRYEVDVAEYVTPNTMQEAMNGEDATQWAVAIQEELNAHESNHTWSIVPRTPNMNTIDSKWVFRLKENPEEGAMRFKARLCARGFMQKEGVDYTETFAPVVRYDSLRVLLATVAENELELTQFDVRTAFLYGEVVETIYMKVPEGLDVAEVSNGRRESVVCKLEKSLYGLKQAPRCWNKKFTQFLNEFELKECEADPCVFVGQCERKSVLLALFVDDGLVAAESKKTLDIIIKRLSDNFKITIGDSSVFVGLQIERNKSEKSLVIHQSAYVKKIIEKYRMIDAKVVSVPADPHVTLSSSEIDDEKSNNVPYREAVGSLVFLASVSRPDIAYAVNVVSRYLNNHNVEHWRAVKRIFSYLKGTAEYGIKYVGGGSKSELVGFSDADYAGDIETRRSTTGYVFCLTNGAVSWSSQRQKLVTLSTTEAEYVAASAAARESIWLRKLLSDIGCPCEKETTLFVDNQSAIQLVKNPVYHKRTKHIDIRYHFIREKTENGDIAVEYVPSEEQRADIFTKALPRERFGKLCEALNLQAWHLNHSNGGSVENVIRA